MVINVSKTVHGNVELLILHGQFCVYGMYISREDLVRLKRIITYLYEYQNGMRRSSAGVFKLDLLGEECRIQLNLQGSVPVEEQGTVYFVVRHGEGNLIGVPVGETSRYRASGGGNWVVRQKGICGSRHSFDDVHGMAVRYPSGRYLASCWEEKADERFLRGDFAEEKELTEKAGESAVRSDFIEQNSTEKTKEAGKSEAAEYKESAENLKIVEEIEDDEHPETAGALEAVLSSETVEASETVLDSKPVEHSETALNSRNAENPKLVKNMEDIGSLKDIENLRIVENLEIIEDNPETAGERKPDGNSETSRKAGRDFDELHAEELSGTASKETLQRMDISDIRSLPKKNWHLCSNSFLIHGFFSYHYLVRKDVEEDGVIKSYLGVPGIYAKPERAMAMLFGFPEFEIERRNANNNKNTIAKEQAGGTNGANSREPRIPEGSFGYWLCQIEV